MDALRAEDPGRRSTTRAITSGKAQFTRKGANVNHLTTKWTDCAGKVSASASYSWTEFLRLWGTNHLNPGQKAARRG